MQIKEAIKIVKCFLSLVAEDAAAYDGCCNYY